MLLEKLQKKNTNIFFESYIDSIELKKNEVVSVIVNTSHEKMIIKPKYVIGADGPESELRKKLNIESKILAKFRGFGVLAESKKEEIIPHAKIYFDKQMAPGGYIYAGSVAKQSFFCVVIDDIFSKKSGLRDNLENFLKHKVNEEISIKNYFNGFGITGIYKNQIKNVLLTGGAALLYDPFLGYGLNYAIESAYAAAQAIIKNNMEMYQGYVKKINQELQEMYSVRKIWRKANNMFFDNLIRAFNGKYNKDDDEINKILELFVEVQ
jgi:flavin-dependent dehydrogenase